MVLLFMLLVIGPCCSRSYLLYAADSTFPKSYRVRSNEHVRENGQAS